MYKRASVAVTGAFLLRTLLELLLESAVYTAWADTDERDFFRSKRAYVLVYFPGLVMAELGEDPIKTARFDSAENPAEASPVGWVDPFLERAPDTGLGD
jgi:hypothetical protein